MDSSTFITIAKQAVLDYLSEHKDLINVNYTLTLETFNVLYEASVLNHNIAVVSPLLAEGIAFVVTYNGEKNECCVDVYKTWARKIIRNVI